VGSWQWAAGSGQLAVGSEQQKTRIKAKDLTACSGQEKIKAIENSK